MFFAVSVLISLLAPPARAADCLSSLQAAAQGGDPAAAQACFAPDAQWLDAGGAAQGPEGVRAGFERLARRRAKPEGALAWTRLSTGTWLLTGLRDSAGQWVLLAADLAGGPGFWQGARVYAAARPWGAPKASDAALPRDSARSPVMTASAVAADFNATFTAGRVEEWLSRWTPDAEFVSVIGPFVGPEVGTFFRKQAERYIPPTFTVTRDHGASPDGELVVEGVLDGRCRASGSPFAFPFIMTMRWRGELLSRVYEGFTAANDGCGPFWTSPR